MQAGHNRKVDKQTLECSRVCLVENQEEKYWCHRQQRYCSWDTSCQIEFLQLFQGRVAAVEVKLRPWGSGCWVMFGLQSSTRRHSYKENKSVVPLDPSVEASRLACTVAIASGQRSRAKSIRKAFTRQGHSYTATLNYKELRTTLQDSPSVGNNTTVRVTSRTKRSIRQWVSIFSILLIL